MIVSLVIPAYNEENNIPVLISEVYQTLSNVKYLDQLIRMKIKLIEFIFVDDGSTDNTLQIIKNLAHTITKKIDLNYDLSIAIKIEYISFTRNFGHQEALSAGLLIAAGDLVITMDADLQHPPELIPALLKKHEDGYKVVHTLRKSPLQTKKHLNFFFKEITSRIFYRLMSILSGVHTMPGMADFRALDKTVVLKLNSLREPKVMYRIMLNYLGYKSAYIEYSPNPRFSGNSKYSFRKMCRLALLGVTSFTIFPLRIGIIFSFIFAILCFLYLLYVSWAFYNHKSIPGWTSVIASSLFIGSIQLIILGIIGEYLGKSFLESKRRPTYVIEESSSKSIDS